VTSERQIGSDLSEETFDYLDVTERGPERVVAALGAARVCGSADDGDLCPGIAELSQRRSAASRLRDDCAVSCQLPLS
jgi:hypothetical protein